MRAFICERPRWRGRTGIQLQILWHPHRQQNQMFTWCCVAAKQRMWKSMQALTYPVHPRWRLAIITRTGICQRTAWRSKSRWVLCQGHAASVKERASTDLPCASTMKVGDYNQNWVLSTFYVKIKVCVRKRACKHWLTCVRPRRRDWTQRLVSNFRYSGVHADSADSLCQNSARPHSTPVFSGTKHCHDSTQEIFHRSVQKLALKYPRIQHTCTPQSVYGVSHHVRLFFTYVIIPNKKYSIAVYKNLHSNIHGFTHTCTPVSIRC